MKHSVVERAPGRCPASAPNSDEVLNAEMVARVLHSNIDTPIEAAFQIDELCCSPSAGDDHDCGKSAGVSVQRTPPASENSLREMSASLAAQKAGREPRGAALARAQSLRKIRIPQFDGQVVFILPDGSPGDPGHTVVRIHPEISGGLRKKVREQIVKLFQETRIFM